MGTPEDPNAPRLANRRGLGAVRSCTRSTRSSVAPGQTYAANFAHNWTDGARVVIIWGPIVLLALWLILAII